MGYSLVEPETACELRRVCIWTHKTRLWLSLVIPGDEPFHPVYNHAIMIVRFIIKRYRYRTTEVAIVTYIYSVCPNIL